MADPAEGGGSEQDDVSFLRTVSSQYSASVLIRHDVGLRTDTILVDLGL